MAQTHWKVGDLAKQTGLTVRTLHHYDQIGLLKPSAYTDSGYRLYDVENLACLQKIVSLRQLGFSLEAIRTLLEDRTMSAVDVLNMHLSKLREQLIAQEARVARLESAANDLANQPKPTAGCLLNIIEVITMMENYYTPEQLTQLRERREQIGEDAMLAAQEQWRSLIDKMRAEMEKGTSPSDPVLKPLLGEWHGLIQKFTGGDTEIEHSLGRFNRDNPEYAKQHGMNLDGELLAFVAKASAKMKSN